MMKSSLALLLLSMSGVGADLSDSLGRTAKEPNPMYQKFADLMQSPVCANADNNDLSEEGQAAWQECKLFIAGELTGNRAPISERRLQDGLGPSQHLDGELTNGTAADFLHPCYELPEGAQARLDAGWQTADFADDGYHQVDVGFTFTMYGNSNNVIQIDANGALTFGDVPFTVPFFAMDFPNWMMDMIAPFWADVDVRPNLGLGGSIWWQDFGDHLAVIWDDVGFANGGHRTMKRNTFQVVISDGNLYGRLGQSNVCFCYIDMDWWEGLFDVGQGKATVGLSSTVDLSSYVQIGRFGKKGDDYDGPFGEVDGIDWLDYKGSSIKRNPEQVDPIQGLCFQTGLEPNIPPVPSGFPKNDTYGIPCRGRLDLSLAFATPEANQYIILTDPPNLAEMQALGLTYVRTATEHNEAISIKIDWSPEFSSHTGEYTMVFFAEDNLGSNITRTLTIKVATCGSGDDIPTGCVPIHGNTCTEGDPQPFCTPYRSPEHCPMDESFPMYIRSRNQIMKESPSTLEELGYWFHHLQDKAGAYAFTASSGYHAPKVYCCADPSDWLSTCFPSYGTNPTSFVIRAVGDHHSNSAVYVLPSGFGGPELSRPMVTMTAEQVEANIAGLLSPPTKIIIEEFISGSATEASLPNEYKVHAFNGTVGSMGIVMNRNSECGCYAEVDADWNRLDKFGCFAPNFPFGKEGNGTCYAVDLEKGAKRPFPMKGNDLCGNLPLIQPSCLLSELVRIAEEVSKIIGVYVRIDFFVSGDNKIYIQEYTFNHNNGLRHCTAKEDDVTGCIDSCFLGRMWKNNARTEDERVMGGPALPVPSVFADWGGASHEDQCSVATSTSLPPVHDACA